MRVAVRRRNAEALMICPEILALGSDWLTRSPFAMHRSDVIAKGGPFPCGRVRLDLSPGLVRIPDL